MEKMELESAIEVTGGGGGTGQLFQHLWPGKSSLSRGQSQTFHSFNKLKETYI